MKFRTLILISLMLMLPICAQAQFRDDAVYEDLYDSDAAAAMKAHVRFLSAADMEGRKAGSQGELEAARYVTGILKDYGIDVLTPADGETFGIAKENGDTLTSRNVVGYVQGYDKTLRNSYIVVGARLDNLGTMQMTVDGRVVDRVFYGANGNASGLSMMVELARMVKMNSILFRRSVLFVAFGASCETYAGAWYFLNRSFSDVENIDAMINLDMVGMGYKGFYAYTASNADMNGVLKRLSEELQPVLPELVTSEIYPSDHRAFYDKEIPSVMFSTGQYSEHNTDRDTQSVIDYDMMERETEYVYNCLLTLANDNEAPEFRPGDGGGRKNPGDDVVAYYDCDQRPTFLNSADLRQFLEKWVYQYLKYPEAALREGIQGRVTVDFIIDKDGKVTDAKVTKGVSPELDAEALKVVNASPKWKPGKVNGNKVRTWISLPIEFRLKKK